MQWYFQDGGQTVGPLDDSEFHELVSRGRIGGDTLVRREGEQDWVAHREALRASKVERYKEELDSQRIDLSSRAGVEGSRWVPGMAAGTLHYGSFGARLVAKIIDAFIQFVAMCLIIGVFALLMLAAGGDEANPAVVLVFGMMLYAVMLIFPLAYNAEFVARRGATPGKAAMGLRVTDAQGKMVSRGRAWGRALAEILSGMTMYIGYLLMLFDNEKRTLHDMVCDTRVIRGF